MKPRELIEQLRGFLINNQWKFSATTIVALAFLFLRQTNYFDPFFRVPLLVFFILLWVFIVFLFKTKPNVSFGLAIFFLFVSGFLLLVKVKPWAERAALYMYGFFIVGVIQGLITEVFVGKSRRGND